MLNLDNCKLDFSPLCELIKNADSILISSHVMPDGDNLASICSLGHALKKIGKNVTIANIDETPKIYNFIPHVDKIEKLDKIEKKFDLFILNDCSDESRIGRDDFMELGKCVVNIDHHTGNTMYAHINLVNPIVSSTCELIFYLIKSLKIDIDKDIAVSLFTGMMTDTIRFLTSSCTPDFYYIIAELVKNGADPAFIGTNVYMRNSINSLRLVGSVLSDFTLSCNNKLAYYILTEDIKKRFLVDSEDTNSIINHILSTNGVESALLFEMEGEFIHLSMRSKTYFDVGQIARELGGGGHINASGTSIRGSMEKCFEIIKLVESRLKEFINDSKN